MAKNETPKVGRESLFRVAASRAIGSVKPRRVVNPGPYY